MKQEPGPQVHEAAAAIEPWLDRFDAVLIGPGLGRDPLTLATVAEVSGSWSLAVAQGSNFKCYPDSAANW